MLARAAVGGARGQAESPGLAIVTRDQLGAYTDAFVDALRRSLDWS
jgi:hypothetical protein